MVQKSIRIQIIKAASIVFASRLVGEESNRTFKEMVLSTAIPQKEIVRCFKIIEKKIATTSKFIAGKRSTDEHPIISFSKNYTKYLDLPQRWIDIIVSVAAKACPNLEKGDEIGNSISIDKTWVGKSSASI